MSDKLYFCIGARDVLCPDNPHPDAVTRNVVWSSKNLALLRYVQETVGGSVCKKEKNEDEKTMRLKWGKKAWMGAFNKMNHLVGVAYEPQYVRGVLCAGCEYVPEIHRAKQVRTLKMEVRERVAACLNRMFATTRVTASNLTFDATAEEDRETLRRLFELPSVDRKDNAEANERSRELAKEKIARELAEIVRTAPKRPAHEIAHEIADELEDDYGESVSTYRVKKARREFNAPPERHRMTRAMKEKLRVRMERSKAVLVREKEAKVCDTLDGIAAEMEQACVEGGLITVKHATFREYAHLILATWEPGFMNQVRVLSLKPRTRNEGHRPEQIRDLLRARYASTSLQPNPTTDLVKSIRLRYVLDRMRDEGTPKTKDEFLKIHLSMGWGDRDADAWAREPEIMADDRKHQRHPISDAEFAEWAVGTDPAFRAMCAQVPMLDDQQIRAGLDLEIDCDEDTFGRLVVEERETVSEALVETLATSVTTPEIRRRLAERWGVAQYHLARRDRVVLRRLRAPLDRSEMQEALKAEPVSALLSEHNEVVERLLRRARARWDDEEVSLTAHEVGVMACDEVTDRRARMVREMAEDPSVGNVVDALRKLNEEFAGGRRITMCPEFNRAREEAILATIPKLEASRPELFGDIFQAVEEWWMGNDVKYTKGAFERRFMNLRIPRMMDEGVPEDEIRRLCEEAGFHEPTASSIIETEANKRK